MSRKIYFVVSGAVPPKSNYRKDSSKASRNFWKRILAYEKDVGEAAVAAGARRHMGKGKASVHVVLVNQTVDLDNALKAPIDGLKNVAFEDDSPEHMERLIVEWREDKDHPGPRAVYTIEWKEAS